MVYRSAAPPGTLLHIHDAVVDLIEPPQAEWTKLEPFIAVNAPSVEELEGEEVVKHRTRPRRGAVRRGSKGCGGVRNEEGY